MPTAKPVVGINAKVTAAVVDPTTGTPGAEITLKNQKWVYQDKTEIKEAPNTSDGMLRTVGLGDYEGSVEGALDNTSAATVIESNIGNGTVLHLKLYRDATHFWELSNAIVSNFQESTGAEDLDDWSFNFMKQSGTVTKPVYP